LGKWLTDFGQHGEHVLEGRLDRELVAEFDGDAERHGISSRWQSFVGAAAPDGRTSV
jgi:hypothetical protein